MRKGMSFFRALLLALTLTWSMAGGTARAADGQQAAILIFYGSLAVAQSQALKASANYYQAIGMGQRGQEMLRLASDLESSRLESDILELQAIGAMPTAKPKELAGKARQQFTLARVAMIAAIASGTKAALDSEGNTLQKLVLGVAFAAQAALVRKSLDGVSSAAKAYETFDLGASNGFQPVSKQALSALSAL